MELQPQNSWQNMGIMWIFAEDEIPAKFRNTFMVIVRYSFGYGKTTTQHKNIDFWAEKTGLTKKTFIVHAKWLEANKFIKTIIKKGFVVGGGKIPYAYAPTFPNKGQIKLISAKIDKETIKSKAEKAIDQWKTK